MWLSSKLNFYVHEMRAYMYMQFMFTKFKLVAYIQLIV